MYIFFTALLTILLNIPFAFSDTLEGTVVSVRPGLLIVNVGGDNLEADFKMEHATELKYIHDLENLRSGDWVNITYWQKNGRMITGSIYKEEKGPGIF
jgi:hypothetical protein